MIRNIDITFDSEKEAQGKSYQLASGYISQTTILFEKENVAAVIQASGSVEFYNTDDVFITAGSVAPVESGRRVYEEVFCQVENNMIRFEFPIYEWIDNYPNCDGEYDRWDTRKVGVHTMSFDLSACSFLK